MNKPQTTIPISQARSQIFQIADDVCQTGRPYTLTERGVPKVVMMSADEFESWQETMEVNRTFPDLDKDIADAKVDYKKGDYVTLDDILAKEGYVLADKFKK